MSSSIAALEALLHEFYQATTPTLRKRAIESELIAIKAQPDSWLLSLRIVAELDTFSNQYVWFFCASTLEYAITRRNLSSAERGMLRETLWNTYVGLPTWGQPQRKYATLAQLIALLAKREFADADPNYITHCIELTKSKFPLGILLLRTTSEEMLSSREDVTTERKNYFRSCISMCTPDIINLLTQYLLIAFCRVNGKDIHSIPDTINVLDYSLMLSLPNDKHLSPSIVELLSCLQHFVSWIPTDLLSEYLFMCILDLSQWRAEFSNVSQAAVLVLNEMLYLQKPLPHTLTLMTGLNILLDQNNSVKEHSEMYVDKFRELLRLYTLKYLPKVIHENELLVGFIKSLYCFTVFKNGALDFTEKLEIWCPIIKALAAHSKINRFNDTINQLLQEIMTRIQFHYNKAELELLENEVVEENTQSEWQQFLTQCIECIALVAESRPCSVFAQVFSHWTRPHNYLLCIEKDIDSGKTYEVLRKTRCQTFAEHLRDLSTVCQAVVRLAPFLEGNNLRLELNCQLQALIDSLFTILRLLTSKKLVSANVDKTTYQTDYDYLYAQILMAIRSLLPIVRQSKVEEMLLNSLNAVGFIFLPESGKESPIVYLAASKLLLCISTVIRPKCFLEVPTIVNLMQGSNRLTYLPREVVANIYISLIGYLVLPWKNVELQQQEFPRRSVVLNEYVTCFSNQFLELKPNMESKQSSINFVVNHLRICSIIIAFFKECSNTSKDMLANAFQPILMKALVYYNNNDASNGEIAIATVDFVLNALGTLQNQMGAQYIKDIISLFANVSSREPLSVSRLNIVEKMLNVFQMIVEQPGNVSISLLPSILYYTIEEILPLLTQHTNITDGTDILSLIYILFDSILTWQWQYFYKSPVQSTSAENLHPEHFMSIMNAYGHILVSGNDPSVVRIVLQSMQKVDDRWRLYSRALFQENLLASFQAALISMLFSGGGALHFELLTNTLYNMGQVDTLKLRESFITSDYPVNLKFVDEVCQSTDIPTFTQNINQLIQDAHCARLTQQT